MFVPKSLENPPLVNINGILGSGASDAFIADMNASMGNSDFYAAVSGRHAEVARKFAQEVFVPMRLEALRVQDQQLALTHADVYRPLTSMEHLQFVPPIMHMAILTMPEVRKLHEQGRIDAFGYDPEDVPQEDVWGRLINNGTVYDCVAATQPDGTIPVEWEWVSTDPNHEVRDIDAVEKTRLYLKELLDTTDYDPTDIRNRIA